MSRPQACGQGAMVIVNRARDPLLERIVAVKTILLDRDAGDRTECEARSLQEAVPPLRIVTVHQIGRLDDAL